MKQSFNDFEIIFVDNASTDESVEFVEQNYDVNKVKIVKSETNLGFAGGNNLGYKYSDR
jgi:GT2 family glycosyltransferase